MEESKIEMTKMKHMQLLMLPELKN